MLRESREKYARVVELADALASGASVREDVWVQLPPRAPKKCHPDPQIRMAFFMHSSAVYRMVSIPYFWGCIPLLR